MPIDKVDGSRFYRGLFGLVRSMRSKVTEDEMRAEFAEGQDTRFGPHFIVSDVKIKFSLKDNPFERQGRTIHAARKLARKVMIDHGNGVRFEDIARSIRAKRDPTFSVLKVRMFNTKDTETRFKQIAAIKDGQLTGKPLETIGEIHVYRREAKHPGYRYDEIKDLLRDFIARRLAREWLAERLKDPKHVQVRWPLPQRTQ